MVSPRASVSHATMTKLKDFHCPGNSESRVSDQGLKMDVEPSDSGKAERSAMQQHDTTMKSISSELVEVVKEEPFKIKQVWVYKLPTKGVFFVWTTLIADCIFINFLICLEI